MSVKFFQTISPYCIFPGRGMPQIDVIAVEWVSNTKVHNCEFQNICPTNSLNKENIITLPSSLQYYRLLESITC